MKKLRMNTQYIDFYLQENQISKDEFARRCDISVKNLNDVFAQKNIDVCILVKIVTFLKITAYTFLFMEKFYPKNKQ